MNKKIVLPVAVEQWVPWTAVKQDQEGKLYIEGPMRRLLDIIADGLNFEYKLIRSPDGTWGNPDPEGAWSGMLGQLQREEVEFAVGPFGVTQSRETVCDFSVPVYSENNAIFMVRPGIEGDIEGFIKPFDLTGWSLILASTILIAISFGAMVWAESKIFGFRYPDLVPTAVLWVLKALTQEGTEWLPAGSAARLVVTTWLLASLVFMSSYSGILTAMLTVPKVTIPIDSLEDLVGQDKLPWRLEAGSMMFQYYREAIGGVRKQVFDGHDGVFVDCYQARKEISSGEFAAICDRTTMKKAMSWDFSSTGRCHLYISREIVFSNVMISMAFKTNSSYLSPANEILMKVKESGIFDKWLADELTNTTQCLRPPSSDGTSEGIKPLNIENFLGPLLILAAGLGLGLLSLLLEISVGKFGSKD